MRPVASPLFQGLSAEEWAALEQSGCLRTKSYPRHAVIFHAGEHVHALGVVLRGTVHIENLDLWGSKSILSSISAGQAFAETYALCGDVMMVGDHFYVGQSARTNEEGIRQFCEILEGWGLEGSEVKLEKVLHLKTGVNYLEDGNMLVSGEFVTKPDFEQYHRIEIPEDEAYAANCIWVNGTVIVPEGYPTVLKAVQDAGYETITVDTSEYRKLDGGLSCLSLRF